MAISKAVQADIPALVKLVNSAYRGEASTQGWTTEAHLLKGELRTDEQTLAQELTAENTALLKYTDVSGSITGCVYLQKQAGKLYLGMLSVSPVAQSQGIGKKLLQAAEVYAAEQRCIAIFMTVIGVRHELIDWYKRHGYMPTGATRPFAVDEKFGIPTRELSFTVLEKSL